MSGSGARGDIQESLFWFVYSDTPTRANQGLLFFPASNTLCIGLHRIGCAATCCTTLGWNWMCRLQHRSCRIDEEMINEVDDWMSTKRRIARTAELIQDRGTQQSVRHNFSDVSVSRRVSFSFPSSRSIVDGLTICKNFFFFKFKSVY